MLDPENANKNIETNRLEYYANLLYSIDGFMSPFSTMSLEAAFCGKPYLTIGFSDNVHKWKIEYTLIQDHVKTVLHHKWAILCLDKKTFVSR